MSELTGRIHSLESFGTVDGPGIRYVVFFQGCPMRCLYCHNPDTWEMAGGTQMTADEIIEKITRNREFYTSGGITATGGEPMLQIDFLTELFTKAKQNGIHTALDTCGILFDPDHTEKVEKLMAVTDLVLLDIKHMFDEEHKKLTGHSNARVFAFACAPGVNESPLFAVPGAALARVVGHAANVAPLAGHSRRQPGGAPPHGRSLRGPDAQPDDA